MRINKNTAIACTIAIIISGGAIILLDFVVPQSVGHNILQDMLLGVFSSFIVSIVIAIVGYFHEKSEIIEKTENNIKSLFINMNVLSQIIGSTLQQIHTAQDLSSLPFGNISGLSSLNVDFLNSMNLGLFFPFCKKGELAQVYTQLIEFQQVAYNIKNISWNLHAQALEYTGQVLKVQNSTAQGVPISPTEIQNLDALKNVINIKTAKLHEYVTGQALELEKLAKIFFKYSRNGHSWEKAKQNLQVQIEDIIRR